MAETKSNRLEIQDTPLAGLKRILRKPIGDHRGYFERMYCIQELKSADWPAKIDQINHTLTQRRGTVRGMHYQHQPHADAKFVSCLRGEVFDVAIDLRENSPTYLQWHGETLSQSNATSLLIPEGFAHGFQTLTDDVEMLYFHSAPYRADAEDGLNPKDPSLAINWPLPITEMSDRDHKHIFLNERDRV